MEGDGEGDVPGFGQVDFFLMAPRGASNWERERRQLLLKRRNQILKLGETEDALPLELTTPYIRCWFDSHAHFRMLMPFFPPIGYLSPFHRWSQSHRSSTVQSVQNVPPEEFVLGIVHQCSPLTFQFF